MERKAEVFMNGILAGLLIKTDEGYTWLMNSKQNIFQWWIIDVKDCVNNKFSLNILELHLFMKKSNL